MPVTLESYVEVAVIVAVPVASAATVASPVSLIVTLALLDDHVTVSGTHGLAVATVADICFVSPLSTVAVAGDTVIDVTRPERDTVIVAVPETESS